MLLLLVDICVCIYIYTTIGDSVMVNTVTIKYLTLLARIAYRWNVEYFIKPSLRCRD